MVRVLFTGGGGAGNEALFRLLQQRYTLHFGDADVTAIDPGIPTDRKHRLPWASDADFVEKVRDLCRRLRIDLLVPSVDEELLILAQNINDLAPTKLMLPSADYVETMLDKLHMADILSTRKIPIPITRTLSDDLQDMPFPCISKPRQGRGSRGVRVLSTLTEALLLKSNTAPTADRMLVQEKIEGVEYTVQMVADSTGNLAAIVPVKVDLKRGITLSAETQAEPRVIAACNAIHQAYPAAGCYNIQLMVTSEGKVLPFEVNPRISTTLCLVVAAGVDPISVFLQGARTEGLITFVEGLRLRRHWANFFLQG